MFYAPKILFSHIFPLTLNSLKWKHYMLIQFIDLNNQQISQRDFRLQFLRVNPIFNVLLNGSQSVNHFLGSTRKIICIIQNAFERDTFARVRHVHACHFFHLSVKTCFSPSFEVFNLCEWKREKKIIYWTQKYLYGCRAEIYAPFYCHDYEVRPLSINLNIM